jgi:hypothetical protein
MKRKRTSIDDPSQSFSSEVLEIWRHICLLYHEGYDESDQMVRDEAIELHRALGLRPWHPLVVDVTPLGMDEDPPDGDDAFRVADWRMVRGIRASLILAT